MLAGSVLLAVASLGFFGASPALASASCSPTSYPPSSCPLTLSSSLVVPGGHVTVAASGYKKLSAVSLSLKCPGSASTFLESVTTDSNGGFSTSLTLPSSTQVGSCTLTASGHSPTGASRVLTVALKIVAPQAPPPSVVPPQQTLPFTGLDVIGLAGVAGLLLVGGVSLLVVARRGRRA